MGWTTYVIAESLDIAAIVRENIRFAFVFRLPFRLRVGDFYRHRFTFRDRRFEVVAQNDIAIPNNVPFNELFPTTIEPEKLSKLSTKAVMVVEEPKIDEDMLDCIRKWDPNGDEGLPVSMTSSVFKAMEAFNHFIVAYATATRSMFGGYQLRQFRTQAGSSDYNDYVRWEIMVLWPVGEELPHSRLKAMLDFKPQREIVSSHLIRPPLHDISAEELATIDRFLSRQEEFIHFELAFEAKSKYFSGDSAGALLMAVMALEGAHAAFVQHELGSRLVQKSDKDLPSEFLRELGMSLCNRLTPYLLMDEAERPPHELITRCKRGITIRNDIVHVKEKKGQYRLRVRTEREISDGYAAVLKVYEHYVEALERRLKKS